MYVTVLTTIILYPKELWTDRYVWVISHVYMTLDIKPEIRHLMILKGHQCVLIISDMNKTLKEDCHKVKNIHMIRFWCDKYENNTLGMIHFI